MSDIGNDDFIYNYQFNRFNENPKDPYSTAICKRRCMILTLGQTSGSLNNSTSCHIFEDQLKDYAKLVDNRKGINNYAKATLDLMSNTKNISKFWKSGLPKDLSGIQNIWEPLHGNCVNPTTDGLCGNSLPPASLVPELIGPKKSENIFRVNSLKQTTLHNFNKPHDEMFVKGSDRKASFPSHCSDGADSYSFMGPKSNLHHKNFYETKENKFGNQPLGTEPKCHKPYDDSRKPSATNKQYSQSWKNSNKRSLCSPHEEQYKDEPTEKSGIYHQLPGGKGYYRNNKPLFARIYGNSSDNDDRDVEQEFRTHFKTAGEELKISNQKKFGNHGKSDYFDNDGRTNRTGGRAAYSRNYATNESSSGFQPQTFLRKSLGGKRSVSSKFVPPVRSNSQEDDYRQHGEIPVDPESELDERLKNIEPRMIELIKNEIMDTGSKIDWDDIAGLQFAKNTIQEIVVWPMLRPDIFTGLRRPPKGILLFGPPGTGKTLIGKCIASQSNSTFFSISASSLTSKWIGDGEKMVRALFAVARCHQPAVVFIDEIDSLLSQRSDTEHESSRRIKTEFLVQLDGAGTGEEDRILVIGATNRPQELDEAARRRLVKRLYIPLPDIEARKQLVEHLMKHERSELTKEDIEEISCLTDGYSGADMKNLCQEASLGPIRSISSKEMFQISAEQVRPVNVEDFKMALKRVKSSVSTQDLEIYLKWDQQYGSGAT